MPLLSASGWRGGQEALAHVQVLWGEGDVLHCGSGVGWAGLKRAAGLVWAREDGEVFLLGSKVESIRWGAEFRDLSGSVSHRGADEGGRRVL